MNEPAERPAEGRGVFAEVAHVYRSSRKKRDIAWNVYVARPLAAILVAMLSRTPATPNQVTLVGVAIFAAAAAVLPVQLDWVGLLIAALLLQLAYIFDKADGQLARLTGKTSGAGAYFDFFIDEVKALLLVGAMATRMWRQSGEEVWLLVGTGGVALIAIAVGLTNFIRRPEYAGEEVKPGASANVPERPDGMVATVLWIVQRVASFIAHYPSWFLLLVLLDFVEGVRPAEWFLYLYLGVHVLYVARTGLGVVLRLGSPRFYDE